MSSQVLREKDEGYGKSEGMPSPRCFVLLAKDWLSLTFSHL